MTDDFSLPSVGKVRIIDIYERGNTLNVVVETRYGRRKFGLGINKKYIDPETGVPSWLKEVKKFLIDLYGDDTRQKNDLKSKYSDYIGEIDIKDLDKPGKKAKKTI